MEEKLIRPSKKTRNQIYKKALENYKFSIERWEPSYSTGLCSTLASARASIHRQDLPSPFLHMEYYPEIYKRKPTTFWKFTQYWWDPHNTTERISILEQAIKETN